MAVLPAVCLAGIAAIHLLHLLYQPYLHHDVALYLSVGQRLLAGAVPYVDIVDTNPPMMMYLGTLAALFSRISGVHLAASGLLLDFALVLLAGFAFSRGLALNLPLTRDRRYLIWAAWLFLSLWVYIRGEFGQKEQLLVMFVSPWLLLRHARYARRPVRLATAISLAALAAVGLTLKPFYLLALGAGEGLFALHYRRWRIALLAPEAFALALGGIFFLGHFFLVPGMSAFYTEWLPWVLKGYSAYDRSSLQIIVDVLYTPYIHIWLIGLAGLWFFAQRLPATGRLLARSMVLFAAASLLLYLWQQKGWFYQMLPFFLGALLAALLWVIAVTQQYEADPRLPTAIALLACALLLFSSPNIFQMGNYALTRRPLQFPNTRYTDIIRALTAPDEPVLFVSTNLAPGFPSLTYTERPLGGRFVHTFPIAFAFRTSRGYEVPQKWTREEELAYRMLVEDITKLRPRLVLVMAGPGSIGLPADFDVAEYLNRRGFQSTVLADYVFLGYTRPFATYYLPASSCRDTVSCERHLPTETIRRLEETGILSPTAVAR